MNTPFAVKIVKPPVFTTGAGTYKTVPRASLGDVGVAIEWDGEDFLVLLDTRVEHIAAECLEAINDPTRTQMWTDCLYLEVGDQNEAFIAYWRHIGMAKRMYKQAVKVRARCKAEKPLREFGFDAYRRDGYANNCKDCDIERKK